jgi:hypothetical protein
VAGKSLRLLILINLFAPLPRLVRWQRIAALRSILITKQYHEWKFMENHLFQARFGRPGAFVAALQKLRGKGTDISEEAKEIKVPKKKTVNLLMFYCKLFFLAIYSELLLNPFVQDFTEKLQSLPKAKMLDLFQKDYIHAVTVSISNMSCIEGKCFCGFLKNQFVVRLE